MDDGSHRRFQSYRTTSLSIQMNLSPFISCTVVGLSIAAPVGPIGVLCIRRALFGGWKLGLATGLGAAVADALYGCVAALGLDALTRVLIRGSGYLGIIGGVFLVVIGVRTWRSKPPPGTGDPTTPVDLLRALGSTVVLTLANPATILSFAALFVGFGVGTSIPRTAIPIWIAGVFAGSAAWWLLLSVGVSGLRRHFEPHWLRTINRLSGVVLVGFGINALIRTLQNPQL